MGNNCIGHNYSRFVKHAAGKLMADESSSAQACLYTCLYTSPIHVAGESSAAHACDCRV